MFRCVFSLLSNDLCSQAYKNADERRILKSRELMMEYVEIETKVKPLVQKCLEEMDKSAGAIDPNLVTVAWVTLSKVLKNNWKLIFRRLVCISNLKNLLFVSLFEEKMRQQHRRNG